MRNQTNTTNKIPPHLIIVTTLPCELNDHYVLKRTTS